MAEHNELGKEGESLAITSLKEKGYAIKETNWRFQHHEVDIIGEKGDLLIFAEVKTRSSNYFGEPEVFVTRSKQKSYVTAAHAYVLQHDINKEVRFDIIAITKSKGKTVVNHIESAFSSIF